MIAFFDTNIHINLLTGAVSFDHVVQEIGSVPVRLSPVVANELLRGVSKHARDVVERVSDNCYLLNRRLGGNAGMTPAGFCRKFFHTTKK
jgi:predicted nucleic acid-binding protein